MGTRSFLAAKEISQGASILPTGYNPLEYIQSSNTSSSDYQYIDLGMKGTQNTKVEVSYSIHDIIDDSYGVYGSRTSSTSKAYCLWGRSSGNPTHGPRLNFGSIGTIDSSVEVTQDKIITAIVENGKITVNGVETTFSNSGTFTTPDNMYLFDVQNGETKFPPTAGNRKFVGKIYSCKIWDNGTLVRNLVPCKRESDSAIGMYDLVNNQFYANSGTGTFTAGPEIKQVEYIESHGDEYIDTLVKGNLNTKLELTYQMNNISVIYNLFGGTATNHNDNNQSFFIRSTSNLSATYANFDTVSRTVVKQGINDTNKHTTILSKNGWYIDDELCATWSSPTSFTTPNNLYICGTSNKINSVNASANIYACKIWDNDVLICDFIPIKAGTEYCLYNLVNHIVYHNVGIGAFTGGEEVILKQTKFFLSALEVGDNPILPTGYTPLEYIEGTGTQYINTGCKLNTTHTYLGGTFSSSSTAYSSLFGTVGDTPRPGMRIYIVEGSTTLSVQSGTYFAGGSVLPYNTPYTASVESNGNSISYIANATTSTFTGDVNFDGDILLMAATVKTSVNGKMVGRCYGFKIILNHVLTRNFIPCKNASGKAGMLDLVNNQFYPSNGTEDFIAGPEIKQVEYIASSGTQYIDTDIICNQNTKTEGDFYIINDTNNRAFFGFYEDGSTDAYQMVCVDESSTSQTGGNYRFDGKLISLYYSLNEWHSIVFDNNGIVLDDLSKGTFSGYSSFTCRKSALLFARAGASGSPNAYGSAKIKSWKIYQSNVLVRDYIPVKIGTEYAMYDKVEHKIYHNAGTGAFTGGAEVLTKRIAYFISCIEVPDFPAGYQKVEYLQSSSSQRINLGLTGNLDTEAIVDAQFVSTSNARLFGCANTLTDSISIAYGTFSRFGNKSATLSTASTSRVSYKINKDGIYEDDVLTYTFDTETSFTTGTNLALFTTKVDGSVTGASAKIYSFKLYDNGTLVRNMVPCIRTSDNKPGMIDLTDNQFYTNSGTGEFTPGPNIN